MRQTVSAAVRKHDTPAEPRTAGRARRSSVPGGSTEARWGGGQRSPTSWQSSTGLDAALRARQAEETTTTSGQNHRDGIYSTPTFPTAWSPSGVSPHLASPRTGGHGAQALPGEPEAAGGGCSRAGADRPRQGAFRLRGAVVMHVCP